MTSKTRTARRSWTVEFKKRVVAEASQPGVSDARIARQYELNANLLFNWKKKFGSSSALLPVEIVSYSDPVSSKNFTKEGGHERTVTRGLYGAKFLEIELPCGANVRCGSDISPDLLTHVLAVLRTKP